VSGRADTATRARLDARVLAIMREDEWRSDAARFDQLARDLFTFQFSQCAVYRRFCEQRGRTPDNVSCWREIPAVPTGAFKELILSSFPIEDTLHVFRTSGTASTGRGTLHLDTLELYEASLLPSFRRFVLPDLAPGLRIDFAVLAPSPEELPDSSLSHMFGVVMRHLASERSAFLVRDGALERDAALEILATAQRSGAPLALCGTAFSLLHLLDALAARDLRFSLARESRVMETGGFKGRAREVTRDALYAEIEARLGVHASRCVNQYGMTELGSQFYDSVLREPGAVRRKLGPPWARVRIVDPFTGVDLPDGAQGSIVVLDLANTGSIAALQTADVGRRIGDGFEVLGREPGAEARGCSIAADTLLASDTA
jgi:Acyl-protein synthetase, LuxE